MKKNINYSIGSCDGHSIDFKMEETTFNGTSITINFRYILIIVSLIVIITTSNVFLSNITSNTNTKSLINEKGFVFEDSDVQFITLEEINILKDSTDYSFDELLSFSRNELYARRGHAFNDGSFWNSYYSQYDWYQETHKHAVQWSEFNDIEKENLRLLISVEKEYGFRS